MVWTFAGSGKIFFCQSAVLILGYFYGYFELKDLFKQSFVPTRRRMAAVEFILLLFLVAASGQFLWAAERAGLRGPGMSQ